MAGDVKFANLFGALATGAAATTEFTKPGFGTVKAAKWTITYDITDDANSDTEYKICHGFTDFTNSRYITAQSEDGSAKEDADCRKGVNDGYFLLTTAGGDDGHGDVTAIADGVRFTNQAVLGRAVFIKVTLFGGADLSVECGSHVLTNRTPDVSTNVQTTNIDQDVIFFIVVDLSAEDSAGTAVNSSVGMATTGRGGASVLRNRCIGFTIDHNAAVGDPIGVMRNNRCLSIIAEDDSQDWSIELTAADATTFTTTIRDADPGAGMEVYYLALAFGGGSRSKSEIGSIDSPVVSGDWSKTGLVFKPGYVDLTLSRNSSAENTIENGAGVGSVGFSANTGPGEETCHGVYDEDSAATINTNNSFRSRAIYLFFHDGVGIRYDLSHSSFDSGGWTYSQVGTPSSTARPWHYLVIEETAAAVAPSGAGAQTLAEFTQAGVGLMQPSGVGAQALAALLQSGIGVMQPSGSGAQALAALLQAGVGVEIFTATGVQALAELLQAGVGVMQPSGAGAQALAALLQSGVGVQIFTATGIQTLVELLQVGVGVMQPSGSGAQILAELIQAGVGVHVETVTGIGVQTLVALLQSGVGVMQPSGVGVQALAALLQSGVGVEIFTATGSQVLAELLQLGVGVMQPSGTGIQVLAVLLQSGVGVEIFTAIGAQVLAALLQSGVGVMQPSGSGAQVLAALLQAGVGVHTTAGATGSGAQVLVALLQSGAGVMVLSGVGAQTLAALLLSGVDVQVFRGKVFALLAAEANAVLLGTKVNHVLSATKG